MRSIGKNDDLLRELYEHYFLIERQVRNLTLYTDDSSAMAIEVLYDLLTPNEEKKLKLIFTGIEEYQFEYASGYNYKDIKRLKFLKEDDLFYLALDPEDAQPHISLTDRQTILAKNVQGYVF